MVQSFLLHAMDRRRFDDGHSHATNNYVNPTCAEAEAPCVAASDFS